MQSHCKQGIQAIAAKHSQSFYMDLHGKHIAFL